MGSVDSLQAFDLGQERVREAGSRDKNNANETVRQIREPFSKDSDPKP